MTISISYPPLIHPRRDARNGMYPDLAFIGQAAAAENHITAFRKKCVFDWKGFVAEPTTITGASGTTNHSRWMCRTGYGTVRLVARAVLARPEISGADPYVRIVIDDGGFTDTFVPDMHPGGTNDTGNDSPDTWIVAESSVAATANTTYKGLVTTNDYARIVALMIYEEADGVPSDSVDYYNTQNHQVHSKIYDAHRQRILPGLSNMWKSNGGLQINWGQENGAARTRTSATAINLIDNTTTGTPTADSPGWKIDGAYRTTMSRAVIPCMFAVYGSISAGSGTVRLTDTAGTSIGSITINSATPQWWTATANLVASAAKKYDPMYLSDGANTLSVTAASLFEYEG